MVYERRKYLIIHKIINVNTDADKCIIPLVNRQISFINFLNASVASYKNVLPKGQAFLTLEYQGIQDDSYLSALQEVI